MGALIPLWKERNQQRKPPDVRKNGRDVRKTDSGASWLRSDGGVPSRLAEGGKSAPKGDKVRTSVKPSGTRGFGSQSQWLQQAH